MNILVKVLAYFILLSMAWLWLKTIRIEKKRRWFLILLVLIPSLVMELLSITADTQAIGLITAAVVSAIISYVFTKALQLPWWRRILFALGHGLLVVFGMTVATLLLMVITLLFFKAKTAVIA